MGLEKKLRRQRRADARQARRADAARQAHAAEVALLNDSACTVQEQLTRAQAMSGACCDASMMCCLHDARQVQARALAAVAADAALAPVVQPVVSCMQHTIFACVAVLQARS